MAHFSLQDGRLLVACRGGIKGAPDLLALAEALDGPFHAIKQRWRDEVRADEVLRDPALTMEQAREWTMQAMVNLSNKQFITAGFPAAVGGTGALMATTTNLGMPRARAAEGMADADATIWSACTAAPMRATARP